MSKRLLVVSNHDPSKWTEDQRKGWDEIVYYPFPNVDPHKGTNQIIADEVSKICDEIRKFYSSCGDKMQGFVTLQGEFTVCYYVFKSLAHEEDVKFIFPTTERKAVETDGIKTSVFEFVKWR